MSRRTLLGTGLTAATVAVAVVAAREGGVLDDALQRVGVEPHPEPDPGDTRRLRRAAEAQGTLIAAIDATIARHPRLGRDLKPLRMVADEQLVAVGGRRSSAEATDVPTNRRDAAVALSRLAGDSAAARADDAVSSGSPDVARVLASMSAGLSQLATKMAEAS
ncbi:hypothetical protein [Aeromicrobium sp.]|uniref:hypothetical protein n=1 Tax=Aeromicrobium sp. TaxID=1871063 RepID=UPI003D6C15FF